ncbi:MAG: mechanosensitive ion channel family protein [Candidatus Yanofskybacteria bacterium]|nr:mechanosensitive ion channel family protein [Candidatus Yanofskybacteria bacterium]
MSADFLQYTLLYNPVHAYVYALGTGLTVWVGLWVFRNIILRRLRIWAKRTESELDDLLIEIFRSFNLPFYLLLSVGAGAQFIQWPPLVGVAGYWAALIVLFYIGVRALTKVLDYLFKKVIRKRLQEETTFDPSVIQLLRQGLKGVIWAVAGLLVLQNLGVNISALIAGLGIGGLAIAFALQNVLSDVFASFSIYFDKPFQTGDFIIVGEDMGTVKRIGIKSTRIESLWGEEIVLPNKALTESRIRNYKRMESRRIVFSFGVTYQTPSEKARIIPQMIKEIMDGLELASLDRAHFKKFGDSSLDFEVMYTLKTSDYNKYMDVQQDINLQLKERFEKEGIEFAYPTRTVFLQK